ncbi:helix-turn-helix domain-containing protein [Fusobacterium necrophorum]|uniref:Helix-turn-helix domain-containing protein n=1 Tax=Fusobacterium necrophorum TaxID=859 RepID=A0A4V1QXI9_9FUSO|nr:helix-turn-helix transcriptional regulator [Fusobacterium necrophorum]RXZ69816.1 helix-turn-helix domain-containing protein [Fusobacterium necrophorum]
MAEIKDRIILLRQEKNMTQGELAKALNMAPSSIGMYEQGRRKPSYELLEKISDYFNVDMDYLMGRSDIKNRYQAGLKYDWEEEPIKTIDPIIEEYKLSPEEIIEFEKVMSINGALMFNGKEVSQEDKEELEQTLKRIFIRSLLLKRAKERDENGPKNS